MCPAKQRTAKVIDDSDARYRVRDCRSCVALDPNPTPVYVCPSHRGDYISRCRHNKYRGVMVLAETPFVTPDKSDRGLHRGTGGSVAAAIGRSPMRLPARSSRLEQPRHHGGMPTTPVVGDGDDFVAGLSGAVVTSSLAFPGAVPPSASPDTAATPLVADVDTRGSRGIDHDEGTADRDQRRGRLGSAGASSRRLARDGGGDGGGAAAELMANTGDDGFLSPTRDRVRSSSRGSNGVTGARLGSAAAARGGDPAPESPPVVLKRRWRAGYVPVGRSPNSDGTGADSPVSAASGSSTRAGGSIGERRRAALLKAGGGSARTVGSGAASAQRRY